MWIDRFVKGASQVSFLAFTRLAGGLPEYQGQWEVFLSDIAYTVKKHYSWENSNNITVYLHLKLAWNMHCFRFLSQEVLRFTEE